MKNSHLILNVLLAMSSTAGSSFGSWLVSPSPPPLSDAAPAASVPVSEQPSPLVPRIRTKIPFEAGQSPCRSVWRPPGRVAALEYERHRTSHGLAPRGSPDHNRGGAWSYLRPRARGHANKQFWQQEPAPLERSRDIPPEKAQVAKKAKGTWLDRWSAVGELGT